MTERPNALSVGLITSKHSVLDSRVHGCFYRGIESAGGDVLVIGPALEPGLELAGVRAVLLPVPATVNQATLRSPRLIAYRLVSTCLLFLSCLRRRPKVIQACEPDSWIVGWVAARLYGGAVVFDVHEMFPAYLSRSLPQRLQPHAERWLIRGFRWLMRRADAVFHVSEQRRQYYGSGAGQEYVIPSYPSCAVSATARNPADSSVDVIHLGKVVDRACRVSLLEALTLAARQGPEISAAIVGQNAEDFRIGVPAELFEKARHLVRFIPPVPHARALQLAASARIGLALYDADEGARNIAASRKIFEYMALGLPIVGSNVAGVEELITAHSLGAVVNGDAAALADALIVLVKDETRRCAASAAGRAAFLQFYNWEGQSARLMSIYRQLASASAKGSRVSAVEQS